MTSATNEYKIAVLLPTRARTTALKLSIISIFNRVLDLESVQLLLGFDSDDEVGLKYFSTDIQPWLEEKVSEAGKFPFAGAKVGHKEGPAGQWRNKGPKANKPAKAGDLVGGSAS